ncbi:conserved hypothetical protein [Limnobacter sp. 130]|uniref:ABC-three component system protein n=1 Tax=Limnobacter sp. 130 TaxID=2653147 RepID=UPI0012EFBC07|nr:ABC-three component system protein [Limnobacter sp. 130]VWX34063.1 conserved hypothetical protein [Limnobacter sp. 130]
MSTKSPKAGPKPNQYVVKRGAVPPAVYLLHISDKQWEEFIEAACRHREVNGAKYASVKVLGNAGDKGRDVEARLEPALVADRWDLYQAKHYEKRLTPGNAYPELVKLFGHLMANSFPVPRKYYFCAPRNLGPDLHDLIAKPEEFRKAFLVAWKSGSHGLKDDVSKLTSTMEAYVKAFDFSRFEECQVHDLLTWHEKDTKAHYKLFGIEPERGDDPVVPQQAETLELIYIEELVKAYAEHCGSEMSLANVVASEEYGEHLASAREAFYSAEGLKRFSRDIYTEDEFATLLGMVLKGVRLVVRSPLHKTGLERHEAAIMAATTLSVTDSVLYTRLRGGDLPGACHHLVNEKQLKWVR